MAATCTSAARFFFKAKLIPPWWVEFRARGQAVSRPVSSPLPLIFVCWQSLRWGERQVLFSEVSQKALPVAPHPPPSPSSTPRPRSPAWTQWCVFDRCQFDGRCRFSAGFLPVSPSKQCGEKVKKPKWPKTAGSRVCIRYPWRKLEADSKMNFSHHIDKSILIFSSGLLSK